MITLNDYRMCNIEDPETNTEWAQAEIFWRGKIIALIECVESPQDDWFDANLFAQAVHRKVNELCVETNTFPNTTVEAVDLVQRVVSSMPSAQDDRFKVRYSSLDHIVHEFFIDSDTSMGKIAADIRLSKSGDVFFNSGWLHKESLEATITVLQDILALNKEQS